MSTFTTPIQHSSESSSQCNKARKGNIRHTDHKGRNKIALICRQHLLLHKKKKIPPNSPKPFLEPTSDITGYKINKPKPFIFLCSTEEHLETKIKNTRLFIVTQKNKILRHQS